jgi:hypothetical protein
MKKIIISLLLSLAITVIGKAQNSECKKWKNGRFYMLTQDKVRIEIARKGGKQIEYNTGTGDKSQMKVKWVNSCTYQLRYDPKHPAKDFPPDMVLTVKLYEFHDNYAMIEITCNLVSMKLQEPFYKSDE